MKIEVAARLTPEPFPMLWQRRLPLGTLSLIAGVPGCGKSQLTAKIACDLSRTGLVTILSNPEDDLASVIRPRLEVHKANLELIYLLDEPTHLPSELDRLEDLIRDTGASLLVLDPIAGHFAPEGKVHNRRALHDLITVAKRTRCSVLGIHHTVKYATNMLDSVGGSMGGLIGSSRAVYLLNKIAQSRSELCCLKMNGSEQPLDIIFSRVVKGLANGLVAPAMVQINSVGPECLRSDALAGAAEWLTLFLAAGQDGHRLAGEVKNASDLANYDWEIMLQVATELGFLTHTGFGNGRWQLPDAHPLRSAEW